MVKNRILTKKIILIQKGFWRKNLRKIWGKFEPKLKTKLEPKVKPEFEPKFEPKFEPEFEPKFEPKFEPNAKISSIFWDLSKISKNTVDKSNCAN